MEDAGKIAAPLKVPPRRAAQEPESLRRLVEEKLYRSLDRSMSRWRRFTENRSAAGVLLLVGCGLQEDGCRREVCLVLNRRSQYVRQGGDLCCPGGRMEPRLDELLGRLLTFPGLPLWRWPHWHETRSRYPEKARRMAGHLATCLRESWEEMRLNPFRVRFLGPLPPQPLSLFPQVIHPMVGWLQGPQRLDPNWEVEKIVAIPLRELLDESRYMRYRVSLSPEVAARFDSPERDFPCFVHQSAMDVDILWGATFRIVTLFLETVFGFRVPDVSKRRIIPGLLDAAYLKTDP